LPQGAGCCAISSCCYHYRSASLQKKDELTLSWFACRLEDEHMASGEGMFLVAATERVDMKTGDVHRPYNRQQVRTRPAWPACAAAAGGSRVLLREEG
jgi:hypothetical protein